MKIEADINPMFSSIYSHYDFMNHLFSFNLDKEWRVEAAKEAIIQKKKYNLLDIATGTGDLAITISELCKAEGKTVSIQGSDFNKDMLHLAEKKIKEKEMRNIDLQVEDAMHLKEKANSIDVITTGFSLRSMIFSKGGWRNLERFSSEAYRVLRNGGKLVLLDMAMPDDSLQRAFFNFYSVPMKAIGSLVSYDTYSWLVDTIKNMDKERVMKILASSGFVNIKTRSLSSGIAFLITAEKQSQSDR